MAKTKMVSFGVKPRHYVVLRVMAAMLEVSMGEFLEESVPDALGLEELGRKIGAVCEMYDEAGEMRAQSGSPAASQGGTRGQNERGMLELGGGERIA